MGSISIGSMRRYLEQSISSLNQNKLNGLLAEVDFRNYISNLGFADRVSVGGWIVRSVGQDNFGHNTAVFFPEIIRPGIDYLRQGDLPRPTIGLHTICSTFHQIGIMSYFCAPKIINNDDTTSIQWYAVQLGLPTEQQYEVFPQCLDPYYSQRGRRYNYLRYNTNVNGIPNQYINEEFTKEHIRISFCNNYLCEISDVDGIFWGQRYTYPIEIKEKTVATNDNKLGPYFGLDLGPFVKLAFYASKQGNLRSLFIVKEIDDVTNRNLVNWWFITFEQLAQYASWIPSGGGTNMQGGASTVVKIPRAEFQLLDRTALFNL